MLCSGIAVCGIAIPGIFAIDCCGALGVADVQGVFAVLSSGKLADGIGIACPAGICACGWGCCTVGMLCPAGIDMPGIW
jgi:hypothetical protein